MILAKGNINEFNELMKLGVGDFLIRFKMFTDELRIKLEAQRRKK